MSGREDILARIATASADITTGNGYNVSVVTVERLIKTWNEVHEGQKPWVGVVCNGEEYEWQPGGYARTIMDLSLICHVAKDTQANMRIACDNLLDDLIVRFMKNDPGLNGTATSIVLLRSDTDEEDEHGGFTLRTDWEVVYNRTTNSG